MNKKTSDRNPGYVVQTKDGKFGRTISSKGLINGKVPVYLATRTEFFDDKKGNIVEIPVEYSRTAILCNPETLKVFGRID